MLRLNVKLSEVLLLRFTSDLSYVASILFAKVNFTHVGARKKLRDSAESTHTWLNFPLIFGASDRLEKSNTSVLGFSLVERNIKKKLLQQCCKTKLTTISRINKILLTHEALIHLVSHIRQ